jgi:FixJ family two-component response regulator
MESASELVYVVDDDRRVREAITVLLVANGRNVRAFSSGGEFLVRRTEMSSHVPSWI